MPQPQFLTTTSPTRFIVKLGGLPLPGTGVTMTQTDINDGVSWLLQDLTITPARQVQVVPLTLRSKGVYVSDDYYAKKISMKYWYSEAGGNTWASAKATISQAGEQYITFDNLTQTLVKLQHWGTPTLKKAFPPLLYESTLDFLCREPWARDITPTTGAQNVTAATAVGVNFTITYAGSVFAEPVFTFTSPGGNTAVYTQFKLQNTLSGEVMTVALPSLTGAFSFVLDCGLWTILNGATQYDPVGSFPQLYPPPTTANTFTVTMTYTSAIVGTPTLAWSYVNRWDL